MDTAIDGAAEAGTGAVPRWRHWTLARAFLLASLVVLLANGLVMGFWVARQIEQSALDNDAASSSLYVDSVVSPYLQSLATQAQLGEADVAALDRVLNSGPLRDRIVALKIWSQDSHILYSPNRLLIGRQFVADVDLARALSGQVVADVSDLQDPENEYERQHWSHLVSVYVPVRQDRGGQVIGVTEFYEVPDRLDAEIRAAQLRSWGIVAVLTMGTYVLLAGIVGRGSTTIRRQQQILSRRVAELRRLLDENLRLSERVRQAARTTTTLNEQTLTRISADLHDGPAQALALALMRMEDQPYACTQACAARSDLVVVHQALKAALGEIRTISAGLLLPELEGLSVREVIERAVRDHARRTGTPVALTCRTLPERIPLAVTMTLYRTLQEALSNATRHGKGVDVAVTAWCEAESLWLTVSDRGPGVEAPKSRDHEPRLGLQGMRERARLLGGDVLFITEPGYGSTVRARWPLTEGDGLWASQPNGA